jgi:predicted RNA-binding protein with PIN domain
MDFIASLCPVCEIIFYFLILGYTTGIHAQYQRSCSRGEESDKRRENTDAWQTANRFAEQALQRAVAATAHAATSDYIQADEVAKDASERLQARLVFGLYRARRILS